MGINLIKRYELKRTLGVRSLFLTSVYVNDKLCDMSRPLRIEFDGAIYHVTSRGDAREPIFITDTDHILFLDILKKTCERFNWLCYAYCLMDNHYHLVIETPDGNLSKGMRQLNGVYTQSFNKRHQRVGHVFQGRYKAILIEKESYLLQVSRYVVLNPVRAKIVESPDEWKWSSYRGTSGIEKPHAVLTIDWILRQFDKHREKAKKNYKEFVKSGIGRESVWEGVRGQSLLGREGFVKKLIYCVKGQEEIKEIPRQQRFIGRPCLETLFNKKSATNIQKRNVKIVESVEKYSYSQKEVADYLGLHYSTISRLIKKNQF